MLHTRNDHLDPDPFGVAVSVAGILGGLAAVISLYRELGRSLRRSHAKAVRTLESVKATIDEIDRDVQVIRETTAAAVPMVPASFGPGQRLLMAPVNFREYAKAAEGAISRLRKVLKATHQLERTVPQLPYVEPAASRDVVDVQLRIERLLRDPSCSLEQGLEELQAIVAQVRSMIDQLLAQLAGRQDVR